jgi:hypothetical protein
MTGGGDCGHQKVSPIKGYIYICELPLGHGGDHRKMVGGDSVTWRNEPPKTEMVDHPAHYGGESDPFEHHKVVYGWKLDYYLGNCTKYICRAGRKPGADSIQDLEKAKWYLEQEIALLKRQREESQNGIS